MALAAPIRQTLFAVWDAYDARASAMDAWFAAADALHVLGEPVPDAWQYRPSPVRPTEEQRRAESFTLGELLDDLRAGAITPADVHALGDRMAALVRHLDAREEAEAA